MRVLSLACAIALALGSTAALAACEYQTANSSKVVASSGDAGQSQPTPKTSGEQPRS